MERLKLLRKEKNITQSELAKKMSVNEKTISRWEKGISEISKGQLNLLADILDTWDGYLLGYSDERYMPMEEYMKRAKHDQPEFEMLDRKGIEKMIKNVEEAPEIRQEKEEEITEKLSSLTYSDVDLVHSLVNRLSIHHTKK